jgi:peptidoglycan/xylan/chitin deacetylase (PgdA/CDA1 family)
VARSTCGDACPANPIADRGLIRIATLGYHDVSNSPASSGFQRPLARAYKHTCRVFAEHLENIGQSRLTPAVVTKIDFARGGDHLLLTFDDGGKSAMYVGEELCRRGWHGHFLVTTAFIGDRTFLDRSEIVQLRRAGHVVGSHSHTHPDIFNALPEDAMLSQWRVSCDTLSQLLGEPCVVASVPGGDISMPVLEAAERCGVQYLFTSEPRLQPSNVGRCRILGRVAVKASTRASRVRQLAAMRGWRRALLQRQLFVAARLALPPLYRFYVERRTRAWESSG